MKQVKESYQKKKKKEGRYLSFSDRVTLNYHISASNIDVRSSFLIISGVFFLFVFLAKPRNYK